MLHNKVTIDIVDDHPMIIQGLCAIINGSDTLQIGQCLNNGKAFLEYMQSNEVEFVILDLTLPDMTGLDLCLSLKKTCATAKVLFLSNHLERGFITQAMQNGANGYLLKNAAPDKIINAIERILNGELCFSEEVAEVLTTPGASAIDSIPSLTRREKEILNLIAEGQTTAMTAASLFISPLTVESHRRNLLQKMKVGNVAELISMAMRQGLLK